MNAIIDVSSPEKVMSKHGKSFYFASQVFTKEMMSKTASLYAFCRFVDDCADELELEESKIQINRIQLYLNNQLDDHVIADLIEDINSFGVSKDLMKELVEGALFDVNENLVKNDDDFFNYCYLVAGVVGQMMCPIIGVKHKPAEKNAIALGVGMQITNICRDILEDAKNGRTYIPQNMLEKNNLTLKDLQTEGETPARLKAVVKTYLDIADQYYSTSYQGIAHIPVRPRLAIILAGEIYRSIGLKIKRNRYNVLSGRTYLNVVEKIWVSIKVIPKILSPRFWVARPSEQEFPKVLLVRLP